MFQMTRCQYSLLHHHVKELQTLAFGQVSFTIVIPFVFCLIAKLSRYSLYNKAS